MLVNFTINVLCIVALYLISIPFVYIGIEIYFSIQDYFKEKRYEKRKQEGRENLKRDIEKWEREHG